MIFLYELLAFDAIGLHQTQTYRIQLLYLDGLNEKVGDFCAYGIFGETLGFILGNHHDGEIGVTPPHLPNPFQSGHPRQMLIYKGQVHRMGLNVSQSLLGMGKSLYREALLPEVLYMRLQMLYLIVQP
jgi:hypothetical protein